MEIFTVDKSVDKPVDNWRTYVYLPWETWETWDNFQTNVPQPWETWDNSKNLGITF